MPKRPTKKSSAAAKLLSLGIVDEEVAVSLIQQAFIMAARAAQEGNLKDYRAAMDTVMQFAHLEQAERHKLLDKVLPDQQMLTINGQPVNAEQLWQTMFSNKPTPMITVDAATNGNEDEQETDTEG